MSKITKVAEVFDIPLNYYSKAFMIDYADVSSVMFLKEAADTVITFVDSEGEKFRCTMQDYKNGNVKIYPIKVCDQPL